MRKKGAAEWLSWVLIVAFVIALGVFTYSWISSQAKNSVAILTTVIDGSECNFVSVRADSSCQSMQQISLNITNSNTLPINALIFRTYDLSDLPDVRNKSITLRSQGTREVTVFKQGIIKKLEIIPITQAGKSRIVCMKKAIVIDSISQCP